MAVVRTHRYVVVTGKLAQLLEQRTRLIRSIQAANAAFTAATLIRQDDGSYLDIWRWESAEAMRGTTLVQNFPLVDATATLTTHHSVLDGKVLDER
ncbi:hypothetical protein IU479_28425 [Nocardia abscessus]|uniref:hypothetical protein n=1 Tax=Nocardia TaxID=1817 RepID=UPI001893DB85|nr:MULTISPECIES: hypothetical protein [Nocardia]MBF6222026.1 hypothetical protein [Nocardia abscessus]MDE1673271.1 hypothetical protein [Nocardia gipuzkoensis]